MWSLALHLVMQSRHICNWAAVKFVYGFEPRPSDLFGTASDGAVYKIPPEPKAHLCAFGAAWQPASCSTVGQP